MEQAISFQGEMAIPSHVNVVVLGADTALNPEGNENFRHLHTNLVEIRKTYVYATRQPKGHYTFDEYSERTSPCPWSLCAAGTLH